MPFPTYTYTFTNGTTADATQVNQDFTDILNGISDGTKNINVSAGTFAGTLTANGAVTLGTSSSNNLVINASLASSIVIGTTNTYDIGADALGLRSIYLGSGGSAHSTRIIGASVTSAWTLTLPLTGGTAGYGLVNTDGAGTTTWSPLGGSDRAENYSLATSVGSNAMTVALKDIGGSDPTASSVVRLAMRNATATTGSLVQRTVSAALSVTIPSGATLGHTSAINCYIYVYAIDNAGTVELAVSGQRVFNDGSIVTTTALTAGSTAGTTLYSTSNRSGVAIRFLGRVQSNQATAGTWAANATEISSLISLPPIVSDWTPYTPTTQGLGTPTNVNFLYQRIGGSLFVMGSLTTGTVTAAQARIGLPTGATTSSLLTNPSVVGTLFPNYVSGTGYSVLAEPSVTYFTFGLQGSANAGLTELNGSVVFASAANLSFFAVVPIAGWSSSE